MERARILAATRAAMDRARMLVLSSIQRRRLAIGAVTATAMLVGGATLVHVPGMSFSHSSASYHAMLDEYCFRCHSSTTPRADVNLRALDLADFKKDGVVWEKLLRKLRNHEMPPPGRWKPSTPMIDSFVKYIDDGRDHLADVDPNPGRPTIHRLNRTEYTNVVRDLLAVDIDVSDLLPADDLSYGFDNIGDALNMSPLLLQRYLTAASKIADLAIGNVDGPASYQTYTIAHNTVQTNRMSEDMPPGSRGGTRLEHFFPVDADYEISVTVQRGRYGEVIGAERDHEIALLLDDARLQLFDLPAKNDQRMVLSTRGKYVKARVGHDFQGGGDFGSGYEPDANFKVRVPVKAGTHTIVAAYLKDDVGSVPTEFFDLSKRDDTALPTGFLPGIATVNVAGPFNVTGVGDTPSRQKVFLCHPKSAADEQPCAEKIVSNLLHRAYRRPVHPADLHEMLALYKEGAEDGGFEAGINLALQTILVSPEFLFRMESDPPNTAPGHVYQVSDLAVASRLSFFLWSTMPDDELQKIAEQGKLHDPAVLDQQVRRMLADPRSKSLVTNFAGQWLYLRNIAELQPSLDAFLDFDENLRHAMLTETQMVIESTLRDDQPVYNLLKTDYTYVNQRLAGHYGMNGIYGPEFRRVKLTDPNRFGLLGQASILTVTSYPNRTAPTIRGKWVLEQLLNAGTPPPPPNVPALKEDGSTEKMSMRQRMEAHRANPACAVCHRLMDPIGFALENYDGIGQWRASYEAASESIDPTGTLPDGTKFSGPAGLRAVLLSKKEEFVEVFTTKLLTYALGRGVEEYDMPAIRKIVRAAAPDDYRWSSIILGIVHSTPFEMRKVADPSTNAAPQQ